MRVLFFVEKHAPGLSFQWLWVVHAIGFVGGGQRENLLTLHTVKIAFLKEVLHINFERVKSCTPIEFRQTYAAKLLKAFSRI